MCWGSAAAAAQNTGAALPELFRIRRKFLRPDKINGFAVFHLRQSRIRLNQNRQVRVLPQLWQEVNHLLRAEPAVKADCVCVQALQQNRRGGNVAAGQQLAFCVKGHGSKDRQGGVFFAGEQRRFHFQCVTHGFNQNHIRACRFTGFGGFLKGVVGVFKRKVTHRFQQAAGWADVQRCPFAKRCSGIFHQVNSPRNGFFYGIFFTLQFNGIGTECICGHNIGAGFRVFCVNPSEYLRMRKVPQFRRFACGKTRFLQHGTHAAVTENHSFSKLFPYGCHCKASSGLYWLKIEWKKKTFIVFHKITDIFPLRKMTASFSVPNFIFLCRCTAGYSQQRRDIKLTGEYCSSFLFYISI